DLADAWLLRGRFDAVLALAGKARELAVALADPGLQAVVRERVGLTAAWRAEGEAAHAAFDAALELYESAPAGAAPVSPVVSLSGFLVEAATADDYPMVRLEETIMHFRRLPPRAARASLFSHRSYLLRFAGELEAARDELDAALEIVRASGDELDHARLAA